ncbi:hypothetical protein GEMRC1_000803 [Eukaryota sp. GEM-RC1]
MQLLLSSSDSEEELILPSISTCYNVQIHRSISFVKELPPIPVYLFSLRDDADEVSDYIHMLRKSIPLDYPFIAVDGEWRKNTLDVLQLGTPSICMVIQVHKVKQLNNDLRDLLTTADITKVFKAKQEDVKRIKKMWKTNVSPVYDIESYFLGMGKIYQQRLGKTKDDLGSISHPLSVFSAHGYTLLCTKGRETTMSNWSADTLSAEQIEYAALDAFWIAFNYYLKVSHHIEAVPRPADQPCFSFSNTNISFFNANASSYPFREILPFPDREFFLYWLTNARPSCCDVHDLSDDVIKKSSSLLSSLSSSKIVSRCLTTFASVLFKILDQNNNRSLIFSFCPSNTYSFFFEKHEFNTGSFVNLCLRLLVPLLTDNNLKCLHAILHPQEYPMYFLTITHNLLALAMDWNSLEIIKGFELTSDMFEVSDDVAVLDSSMMNFLSQSIEFNSNEQETNQKNVVICVDLPHVTYFKLNSSSSNSDAATQTLLDSISPTNPRVTIFARSVVKVIDQIILASDTVILNFEVGIDHVIPSLIADLFLDNTISKDFVGLSCTPEDLAQYFFLTTLNNFSNYTSLISEYFNEIFSSPLNIESSTNSLLLTNFYLHQCNQFLVDCSSPLEILITFGIHLFLLKTVGETRVERMVSLDVTAHVVSPQLLNLITVHFTVDTNSKFQFLPYDFPFVDETDPLYESQSLGVSVVRNQGQYHSPCKLKISFDLPINFDQLIVDSMKLSNLFGTVSVSKSNKLTFSVTTLHQLFALERLMLNDVTFSPKLLSLGLGYQQAAVKVFGKENVTINLPLLNIFEIIRQFPDEDFFPSLKDWLFTESSCTFPINLSHSCQLRSCVSNLKLDEIFKFSSTIPSDELVKTDVISQYLDRIVSKFLKKRRIKGPIPNLNKFGFSENLESLVRVGLTIKDLLTLVPLFVDEICDVSKWLFEVDFGPLAPVFDALGAICGCVYAAVFDKEIPFKERRSNAHDFLLYLISEGQFEKLKQSPVHKVAKMLVSDFNNRSE